MDKYTETLAAWNAAERRCQDLQTAYFDEIVTLGSATDKTRDALLDAMAERNIAMTAVQLESARVGAGVRSRRSP